VYTWWCDRVLEQARGGLEQPLQFSEVMQTLLQM
jgi:hypothetical protein